LVLRGHEDAVLAGGAAGALAAVLLAGASADAAGLAADAPPLLRKSVTYHPEPFNWNPAAVTCLA
jgi:hypothetical protein